MENTEVANTSSKNDKKTKKSKNAEPIMHLDADVKPRRSFWRSLFRRNSKKIEVHEEKTGVMSPRLNAIYEEAKSTEEIKDTNRDDIDFQIAPQVLRVEPIHVPTPATKAASLELMSDTSSTSELSTAEEKPVIPEPVKEYSFEYSETSDSSDIEENKQQDKVKFVETVEQKDADSNIVVKDLNPGADTAGQQPTTELETDAEPPEPEPSEEVSNKPEAERPTNHFPSFKRFPSKPDSNTTNQQGTEMPNDCLNTLTGFGKSILPVNSDNSLEDTSSRYSECRFNDIFKMVLQSTDPHVLTYAMSYNPIISSFNLDYSPKNDTFPSEKVARKRKMMSLLNDKTKMAEYLKEIEQQQENTFISEEKTMDYVLNCASFSAPQNSPSKPQLTEPQNEQILYLLENTREKLQTHLDQIDPKVLNLYPDNYFNLFLTQPDNKVVKIDDNITEKPDVTNDCCRKFEKAEKEIDMIFKDLLFHINELKDSCILNGCIEDKYSEPLVTIKPLEIIQPIIDEIFTNVFEKTEKENIKTKLTKFAEFKTYTTLNVQHGENILDEIVEYSPGSYTNVSESNPDRPPEHENSNLENSNYIQINPEPISINQNLIPRNYKENFDSDNSSEDEDIQDLKKSKKFGPMHEKMPDNTSKMPTVTNFSCNNPPDITESLKHIFFGGEAHKSEYNLVEPPNTDTPTAGTSKLDTDVPHLPSVPSTPLSLSGDSSKTQINTLLTKDNNETESSNSLYMDSDLNVVNTITKDSNESRNKDLTLERKAPETNLFKSTEEPLDAEGIQRSIADSLKTFHDNILKINATNKKTMNILNSTGSISSTEGSISILSTITENIETIETFSNQERYPGFITNPQTEDKPDPNNPDKP